MIHKSLPQTLTVENLAKWITENCIDKKMHEEKIMLDEKQIQDLEHRSSIASRQIDKLNGQLEAIKAHYKDGTTEPIHLTIPFTKGLKALSANREFADNAIELGYTKEETVLFGIPVPEKDVVVFVDQEGIEYPTYQEKMTPEQSRAYNTLFRDEESLQESVSKQQKSKKKIKDEFHEDLADHGMKVSKVEGNTVTIETGHPKKKKDIIEDDDPLGIGELPPSDIGGKNESKPFPLS